MFKNLKWLRLTPDRPGRGGTKTGFHTFQQEPINDIRSLYGGHVYRGAWRREFAGATPNQALPVVFSNPLALHGYVYPSLTDPSAVPGITLLSHQNEAPLNETYIRQVDTGTIRMGPRSRTAPPAVFQNINGRCFACEGTGEAMIFDDRTPAIHLQKNQNLGIGTPTQPLPNTLAGNLTAYGTGYVFSNGATGSIFINHPNPDNMLGTILATDKVTPSIIDTNYPGIYSGAVMASTTPNVDAVTSNTTPFTTPGTGVSVTQGTSIVTLVGGVWPAGWKYAGLTINFNGFSFVILSHGVISAVNGVDINGNALGLSNVGLLILGVYDGPTVVNVPYTITGCQVTMKDTGGGNNINTLATVNTNAAAVPPGVALGYSQMTASNLVQIKVSAIRASGYDRNLGNISLGEESDTEASGGSIQTITDASIAAFRKTLTSPSAPFTILDEGAPISVEGAGTGGSTLITQIVTFSSPTSVVLANAAVTTVGPVAAAWWGTNPTISDAVMPAAPSLILTSASNPFVPGDVGQPIVVEGASGALGQPFITTIAVYTGSGQVTLTGPRPAGSLAVNNVHAWWRAIATDVHEGPRYAYAWYDPETGHCSNISPIYQVPRPTTISTFRDFANMTPVFQIDAGSIAYPNQATDGIRFSHIIFFRTLSTPGSSTLYPIGSLNPFVGKTHPGSVSTRGSWNPSTFRGWMGLPNNYISAPPLTLTPPSYWYDWSSDSDLLLSGGFRAPQFTNDKPTVLLRGGITQPGYPYAMAYWDRRTWLVNTQEPDVIAFSCDEAQCPLGVPEESFPPTNRLRLPSVDGRVIGMRTVGDMLLITTERWAYIIAGNNESNYRLMKVSASMPGVGTYQMDEFPTLTGAEGEPTTLFYLGRDRIVYQWTTGGRAQPISQPIQDQLDSVLIGHGVGPGAFTPLIEYQASRLHCVSAWGRRLVVVAPNGIIEVPPLGPSQVHFYDIDNQVWSEGFHPNFSTQSAQDGFAPMTTVYGGDVPADELFSIYDPALNRVVVQSWIRDDTSGTPNYMTLQTFPMNFDGRKTRKQIVAMNLHATAGAWTGGIFVNEATAAIAASFGAYPDPLYSIYAPVATPVDPGAQDIVVLGAQFTNQAPVVGYRFSFVVQKNADTNPAKVYAIDIGYVDYVEEGEGDP